MIIVVPSIVKVSMYKIALQILISVDDWMAEWAIIAGSELE